MKLQLKIAFTVIALMVIAILVIFGITWTSNTKILGAVAVKNLEEVSISKTGRFTSHCF
jgi:energy-converting hydrogenase Eha subunit B